MLDPTNDSSLARRLFVTLALPVALLLVVGVVLGLQIARMNETAAWVDHTDAVLAKTFQVQKELMDQETGLRGFLLTGDRVFLQPYHSANVSGVLSELSALLTDSPEQGRRAQQMRARYDEWRTIAERIVRGLDVLEAARGPAAMMQRKQHMDQVRALADELLAIEHRLRMARKDALHTSNQTTRVIFFMLLAATALVLSLVTRRNMSAIVQAFGAALRAERESRYALEREQWLYTGQMRLTESIQGDFEVAELGSRALRALAMHTGAVLGALFVVEAGGWRRRAGYGLEQGTAGAERFARGEGLIGRAAEVGTLVELKDLPTGYLRIRSALGEAEPRQILVAPVSIDGTVYGVVELAFLAVTTPRVREFLERTSVPLATGIRSAEYRARLKELLAGSQLQAEELQTQGEELRVTNEELEEQSRALRETQQRLEERQQELVAANNGLEAQTAELLRAQQSLREKAREIERASRYKSEFLANMSHELRTPLNSSLILAKLLADNKHGNLDVEQVRYAETIYAAGNDLLALINDILDLSKIEAGRVDVHPLVTTLPRLVEPVMRSFEGVARKKNLKLNLVMDTGRDTSRDTNRDATRDTLRDVERPDEIETDVQRVQQILKNLLSNALKFTEHGEVTLQVEGDETDVRFVVRDTGIGIPAAQHELIFEPFRQGDGANNRKYGGTGLGLSISRDLARLLGGVLEVESVPGIGSTFMLRLPRVYKEPASMRRPRSRMSARSALSIPRSEQTPTLALSPVPSPIPLPAPVPARPDRLLLIVEDDESFARILLELARELDFDSTVVTTADEALRRAVVQPPVAIVLDMGLPDQSGMVVLDRLKRDPRTRHIPVHVISVADYSQQAMAMGAAGYLIKPAKREDIIAALRSIEQRFTRRVRRVLVVEDDAVQRQSLQALLGSECVEIVAVGSAAEALVQLRTSTFDCVVTDLVLPDATGDDLLRRMAEDEGYAFPPVIIYTGRSLSEEEEQRLRRHSSSIIVKGARSPERLLDEVTLFLHQVEAELPSEQKRLLRQARDREKIFEGRKILLAEDDVRNIFALSSILEPKGAKLIVARNGREALAALERDPKIDLVLMDIMMPEMDGLTAMREIRKHPEHAKLPIIALTAKAMRDDQERCLDAGATDYAAKPLDVEMLLSLLRVWMPK